MIDKTEVAAGLAMLEQAVANYDVEYARYSKEWKAGRADIMAFKGIDQSKIEDAQRLIARSGVSNFANGRVIGPTGMIDAARAALNG